MSARTDKAELAQRLETLRRINEITAERDRATMQRDQARRDNMGLQAQLRLAIKERDEARALGRIA